MNGFNEPPGLLFPRPSRKAPIRRQAPFPFAQGFRRGGVAGLPSDPMPPVAVNSGPSYDPFQNPPDLFPTRDTTVLLNPPDLTYSAPPPAPVPVSNPNHGGVIVTGTSPGPEPDPYGGIPDAPWYTAGPYAGGNTNPNNPGYVAPGVGPQPVPGGGPSGAAITALFTRNQHNLKGGGVVPGTRPRGMPHDTYPAMLDPREIVLNEAQQRKISLEPNEKRALPPAIVAQMYHSRMGAR